MLQAQEDGQVILGSGLIWQVRSA